MLWLAAVPSERLKSIAVGGRWHCKQVVRGAEGISAWVCSHLCMGLQPATRAGVLVGSSGEASVELDVSQLQRAGCLVQSMCLHPHACAPSISLTFSGPSRLWFAPGTARRLLQACWGTCSPVQAPAVGCNLAGVAPAIPEFSLACLSGYCPLPARSQQLFFLSLHPCTGSLCLSFFEFLPSS